MLQTASFSTTNVSNTTEFTELYGPSDKKIALWQWVSPYQISILLPVFSDHPIFGKVDFEIVLNMYGFF